MKLPNLIIIFSSFLVSTVLSLAFNNNGELTILQFTDMHFGMGSASDDRKSQALMRQMLTTVNPDLVVVSGDACQPPSGGAPSGWYRKTWESWTAPINEANIPYVYVLGNHDDRGDLNKYRIVRLDQTNPLSLRSTADGITDTTNFYIPVTSNSDPAKISANLWMFDSGVKSCEEEEDGYGCITREAVDWYNTKSQEFRTNHGTNVHHLAFFHIAIPEYLKMRNNDDIYGNAGEPVCCPMLNTGFFSAVKTNGDIQAMFVGHDHTNDFGGFYQDVELVYGRKSGYGSYGNIFGARVIKLTEGTDGQGALTVTRDHYVIDRSGTIIHPNPLRSVRKKQGSCPSLDGNSLYLTSQKIFGLVLIVLLSLLV